MRRRRFNAMETKAFEAVMADVASHFQTPQAVLESPELDRGQKVALLRQWEHDLRLMMVATEENMPRQQSGGGSAETFRAVREALDRLGAKSAPEAASKLGGGSA